MVKKTLMLLFSLFFSVSTSFAVDRSDRGLLEKAKISLQESIALAEKEVSGQAFEAELDSKNGEPVYEITVITEKGEFEVHIDGIKGSILHVEQE